MLPRLTVALVVVLTPAVGLAQAEGQEAEPVERQASPEDAPDPDIAPSEEEARALFTAGRVAFEQGELQRALEHFTRAYELSERPTLLFNIGNTHDRLRHDDEAIDFLTRYLDAIPDAPNAGFVRSRIEVLRANIAQRDEAEAAQAAERARLIAAANTVDATASDVGIALMIGGGVGLLASIGPIVWYAKTTASLNDCMPVRGGCDLRTAAELAGTQSTALALMATLLVTSILTEGAGVVLFVLSPRSSGSEADPESPEVACMLAPNGIGCSGRF